LKLIFEKMKVIVFVSFIGLIVTINGNDSKPEDEINAKALGGDGAKNENEIIKKSKFEDSEDLIDNLHDKRRPNFDEGYGNNQPMSAGAPSALGTNYVERQYKCVSSNKNHCPIEKLVLKETFDMNNLKCTQQSCTSVSKIFVAYGPDWKKHKMIINYESYPSREIYNNGDITLYHCGNVMSGPCKGATACGIVHSTNPNPGACLKSPGLTRVETDFAFLNIKNCGQDFIACSGGGYQEFNPGLMS
jgi:hypothetical protein